MAVAATIREAHASHTTHRSAGARSRLVVASGFPLAVWALVLAAFDEQHAPAPIRSRHRADATAIAQTTNE
jgi:hypothetical protein